MNYNNVELKWKGNTITTAEDLSFLKITGLVSLTETNIYLSGTDKDTLIVSPTGTFFRYYIGGKIIKIIGTKSVTLPDSPHSNGTHYIYIDNETGTLKTSMTYQDPSEVVVVGRIVWDQNQAEGSRSTLYDDRSLCCAKVASKIDIKSHTYAGYLSPSIKTVQDLADAINTGLDVAKLGGQSASYYTNILARLGYTPINKAGDTITGVQTFSEIPIFPSVWRDMKGDISGARAGNSAPSWDQFSGGIYHYAFSPTSIKEVQITYHVDHDWATGTPMYVHIHWSPSSTNTGTVRWGFEISIAKGYGRGAFTTTNTIYVEQAASGVDRDHLIAECSVNDVIPANALEIDAIISIRVFRDATHSNDTYADKAFGIFCDLHYQANIPGTWQKNYPFNTHP
jgi:hypothetical protein